MSGPSGLVFRETAEWRDGPALRQQAARAVAAAAGQAGLVRALLEVGALECALSDCAAPSASMAGAISDELARRFLSERADGLRALAAEIVCWPVPARLRVSRPEGFAYYGLHPGDFAEAAVGLADGPGRAGPVTVIGVRSVGTTLSAVVQAALSAAGRDADRFTVRPEGSPYQRTMSLSADQLRRVRDRERVNGWWMVVDEGPGLSGSSFLSVGEALVAAGAPSDRIVLLGTRAVDPATLVAPGAEARWRRFTTAAVLPGAHPPAEAQRNVAAGHWRRLFWAESALWPATWPMLERLKWQSRDGRWLFKFEGLGPHGASVHARAQALGEAGLGPSPAGPPDERGYVAYPFPAGVPLAGGDDRTLAAQLGQYCARRADLFPTTLPDNLAPLTTMARENVALLTGHRLPDQWHLPCIRPVIADAKMQPHEWLRAPGGALLKSDGAAHGDDHLYPGPTDVAWDLAGAIIEWGLDAGGRSALVAGYRAAAPEDPSPRLASYEIAYAAFRACWASMAAHGAPEDELPRLAAAHDRYLGALRRALDLSGPDTSNS